MRRRLLVGLAFAAGLLAGAWTAGGVSFGFGGAEEDAPRLAQGGVEMEVTNEGSRLVEARLELVGSDGRLAFSSVFDVGPAQTVRREVVSLVEGAYEARMVVEDVVAATPFRTADCPGAVVLSFSFSTEARGVAGHEGSRRCA